MQLPEASCSICGVSHTRYRYNAGRLFPQSYCTKCHAAHMRRTRPKYSELTPEQRQKSNARAFANTYLRRGLLTKGPCELCGEVDTEMHHPDYSRPLYVMWLCRPCHMELHFEQGTKIESVKRFHDKHLAAEAT